MIVDRIENMIAVIEREDGTFFELPLSELPEGVCEGCVLVRNCESYAVDMLATKERRNRNAARTRGLFTKS